MPLKKKTYPVQQYTRSLYDIREYSLHECNHYPREIKKELENRSNNKWSNKHRVECQKNIVCLSIATLALIL